MEFSGLFNFVMYTTPSFFTPTHNKNIGCFCLRQDMTYCGNEVERRKICRMEREREKKKRVEHCCINNDLNYFIM